eukprot:1132522-Pyramimonas_sp.AAC.1
MDGSLKAGTRFFVLNRSQGRRPQNVFGMMLLLLRGGGPGTRSRLPSPTSSPPTASPNGVFSQYDDLFLPGVEGGMAPKKGQMLEPS